MLLIVSVISGCSKEKTINETTEKDTGVITETTAETETTTEEVVETEAPTQKPTEAPKPTEKPTEKPTQPKPTEPKPTQPSGGGQFTFDDGPAESGLYIQDPNENVDHWVRIKNVSSDWTNTALMLDYFEIVPKGIITDPTNPEDRN